MLYMYMSRVTAGFSQFSKKYSQAFPHVDEMDFTNTTIKYTTVPVQLWL